MGSSSSSSSVGSSRSSGHGSRISCCCCLGGNRPRRCSSGITHSLRHTSLHLPVTARHNHDAPKSDLVAEITWPCFAGVYTLIPLFFFSKHHPTLQGIVSIKQWKAVEKFYTFCIFNPLTWKIQEEGKRRLDRAAADDGVGGHALPFLLLLLQAAGEQRALFVSSLSSCQLPLKIDLMSNISFSFRIFLMTIPVVALLQQLFLHFVWQCFQSFESQFFSKYFSTANDLAFGSSPIKVKIS